MVTRVQASAEGGGRVLVLQSPAGAPGAVALEPGTQVEVRVERHGWRTGLIVGVIIDVLTTAASVIGIVAVCGGGCPG